MLKFVLAGFLLGILVAVPSTYFALTSMNLSAGDMGDGAAVYLEPDKKVYGDGDTVMVKLVNNSGRTLEYYFGWALYTWYGGAWVADPELNPAFPISKDIIKPGETKVVAVFKPESFDFNPGEYKIVKILEDVNSKERILVEAGFRVGG
ncbi:hypothetical protein apy_03070 [Aeropyrum pernix]|uniref:Bacterial Ig-like domain-containing protein n=1 Tax=Aeropyrum pernix TaxID=56636 RepID=A0A401H8B3_AERPX|nr:immunoglobulin-like domain-containing protein [Aeropyrum pernix]GBF08582.1 hypothetical protein apy_03070 [Aeropyrum pernix]